MPFVLKVSGELTGGLENLADAVSSSWNAPTPPPGSNQPLIRMT